jgi:hypothetical protein
MKKAKIMLTVIVVMAAVGGVLASKAKGLTTYYKDDGTGVCSITTTVKEVPVTHAHILLQATTNQFDPCEQLTVTTVEN